MQDSDEESQTSMATDTIEHVSNSFHIRVTGNFFVPPSEHDVDKKIFSVAQKWMAKMAESDKKVVLLPWYDSDCGEDTICSYKDIPTSLFLSKKHFHRAKPNEKGGKIYTDLFLNHSKPIDELQGDMSWWLKRRRLTSVSRRYNQRHLHD